jgi:hypothetical protein
MEKMKKMKSRGVLSTMSKTSGSEILLDDLKRCLQNICFSSHRLKTKLDRNVDFEEKGMRVKKMVSLFVGE